MKELFIEKNFHGASLRRINQANEIIGELQAQGYTLSLRQLYYQYVQRGLIPNKVQEYKRLGDLLSKARLAGLVDWSAFEDRGRTLRGWSGGHENPGEYIDGIGGDYYVDLWEGQDNYVEVWIEKDALVGVVERPCNRFRVQYFSCRGYSSQTEQYNAGKRFTNQAAQGRNCHILHLGDHDPSGIDMSRDNQERLDMFSESNVTLHRIALNMNQIEELNPPPNPAKLTDSRVGNYIALYGEKSWELDALQPSYIDKLVSSEIEKFIDADIMEARKELEQQGKDELYRISNYYEEIKEFLDREGFE